VPTYGKDKPTQDFIFHGPFAFTAVDEKRMKSLLRRGPLKDFSQNPINNEDLFLQQYIYEERKQKQGVNDYYFLFWLAVRVFDKEKGFIC
jgi:hypothetical protein